MFKVNVLTLLFVLDVFDRFVYVDYLNFLHNQVQHQHDDENILEFQKELLIEFQYVVPNILIVHLIENECLIKKEKENIFLNQANFPTKSISFRSFS